MDAPVSDDRSNPSQDSGGPLSHASATAVAAPSPTQNAESRDQLIARRRAAQHAWRAAREGLERAVLRLHEPSCPFPADHPTAVARLRLEHAERGERQARRSYYHVAEETGALLSRLAHGVGRA